MKITVLNGNLSSSGGAKTALRNLINCLQENNVEVKLIITHCEDPVSDLSEFFSLTEKDITITRLPIYLKFFRYLYYILYQNSSKIIDIQECDMILINSTNITQNLFYILSRKKVIYFLHTVPHTKLKLKHKLINSLRKKKRYTKYVTVSDYSRNKMSLALGISKDDINVIPNPVSLKPAKNNSDERIKFINNIIKKKSTLLVTTIGSVEKYKNPEIWVKVAESIITDNKDCIFIWVGTGSQMAKIKSQIKSSLASRIILVGEIKNIFEVLEITDIYFQPSIKESQGISILEAMSLEIPCVASNAEGIKETLNHGQNGLLSDPFDEQGFISNLKVLIEQKELRHRIGQNGKKTAEQKFNISTYNKRIYDLIK